MFLECFRYLNIFDISGQKFCIQKWEPFFQCQAAMPLRWPKRLEQRLSSPVTGVARHGRVVTFLHRWWIPFFRANLNIKNQLINRFSDQYIQNPVLFPEDDLKPYYINMYKYVELPIFQPITLELICHFQPWHKTYLFGTSGDFPVRPKNRDQVIIHSIPVIVTGIAYIYMMDYNICVII